MTSMNVGIAATQTVLPVGSMWLSDPLQVRMQSYNVDQKFGQFAYFPENAINHTMTESYPSIESAGHSKPMRYARTT